MTEVLELLAYLVYGECETEITEDSAEAQINKGGSHEINT